MIDHSAELASIARRLAEITDDLRGGASAPAATPAAAGDAEYLCVLAYAKRLGVGDSSIRRMMKLGKGAA